MGKQVTTGVGDCKCSADPDDVLVTFALGSCIGVAVYDPICKVGGLLHLALPDSRAHPQKALENPYYFADTGVPLLIDEVCRLGAQKRRLRVKLAGGARTFAAADHFEIGHKNYVAVRRLLWKAGLLIAGEDCGGTQSRTVRLELKTGRCWWTMPDRREVEIGDSNGIGRQGDEDGTAHIDRG